MDVEATDSSGFWLIVEDQNDTRLHLETVIRSGFPGLNVASVRNLKEARSWISRHISHLRFCLIDLGLPDGNGIDLIRALKTQHPTIPSVVISIFGEDSFVFEAIAAGAFGYILKDEDPDLLADTLRRILRDEPPISPSIARRLLARFQDSSATQDRSIALSTREKETLALLVRGHTIPEAAERMGLSAQTVAGYVKVIYQKMHVTNRAEVVREAVRLSLI